MRRRVLLCTLLIYVALDLSLPGMPGAFVFEVTESIEGAHAGRARPVSPIAIVPPVGGHGAVIVEPRPSLRHRRALLGPGSRAGLAQARAACLPRAVCTPPPLSEDPH